MILGERNQSLHWEGISWEQTLDAAEIRLT